ncbi:hypothetical protein IscW_ISCW001290, partial [Ixodes scapularis]
SRNVQRSNEPEETPPARREEADASRQRVGDSARGGRHPNCGYYLYPPYLFCPWISPPDLSAPVTLPRLSPPSRFRPFPPWAFFFSRCLGAFSERRCAKNVL